MSGTQKKYKNTYNPLEIVEGLAEQHQWSFERSSELEVQMVVTGSWADMTLSFTWHEDIEQLSFACAQNLKAPDHRYPEIWKLLSYINTQLVAGHFEFWKNEGIILYRNALMLNGNAFALQSQLEGIIKRGLDAMQNFFPAFQFVIWGGHDAETALQSAILETHGEA